MASTPLGQIGEGYGTASYYRPKKSFLRDYEAWQHADTSRLRGSDPYGGSDLGFNPRQMAAKLTEGSQESAAEYASEKGSIERAARGGGMRTLSGAYFRGKQRALESHLGRIADVRRRNLIADAYQRRQDLAFRMGQQGAGLGRGASLYNQYANQASRRRGGVYGGLGDAAAYAAMAGAAPPAAGAVKPA